MAATIGFRPTVEDERIIGAAIRGGERTGYVGRRALRLEREIHLDRDEMSEAEHAATRGTGLR